eukprot:TRINITY_DN82966_c0_g1_i1.p1 TRINITY_DN82966_c0_g1~~TRINITY_DN82966_c0_g1_i1.p1  ORF type:complete len:1024 (-),score=221.87 TRINITY_DN82966_c0_g1_i1:162-3233(-)
MGTAQSSGCHDGTCGCDREITDYEEKLRIVPLQELPIADIDEKPLPVQLIAEAPPIDPRQPGRALPPIEQKLQNKRLSWGVARGCDVAERSNGGFSDTDKTEQDRMLIAIALRMNVDLQCLVAFDDLHVERLVKAARRMELRNGDVLLEEGDMITDSFFIVGSGSFELKASRDLDIDTRGWVTFVNAADIARSRSACSRSLLLLPGCTRMVRKCTTLGEQAMLRGEPVAFTAVAAEDSHVWAIDQASFNAVAITAIDAHLRRLGELSMVNDDAITNLQSMQGSMPLLSLIAQVVGEVSPADAAAFKEEEAIVTNSLLNNGNFGHFAPLTPELATKLFQTSRRIEIKVGEVLIREGDRNTKSFFVVASGKFEVSASFHFEVVTTDQGRAAHLERPDHADKDCDHAEHHEEENHGGAGHKEEDHSMLTPPDSPKSHTSTTTKSFSRQSSASPAAHHTAETNQRATMRNSQVYKDVLPPHIEERTESNQDAAVQMCTVSAGTCIGELAVMYNAPPVYTATCLESGSVWAISKDHYKSVQRLAIQAELNGRIKYLQNMTILEEMSDACKEEIARAMEVVRFKKGETIFRQGDPGTAFFVLFDGEVQIEVNGVAVRVLSASLPEGKVQYFGERALLKNELRSATVTVISEKAAAMALEKDDFNFLMRSLTDKLGNAWKDFVVCSSEKKDHEEAVQANKPLVVSYRDLQKFGMLGVGTFGPIELCKYKDGRLFALKTMNKGLVRQNGSAARVLRERDLLLVLPTNPFVLKAYSALMHPENPSCILLVEAAQGGDLDRLYKRNKKLYGNAKVARFYLAGMVWGIAHLHKNRILHRNLMPENVLISGTGYPKLAGTSIAKVVIGKTYTVCGSPSYCAPEVLLGVGQTKAVDWWSLGVVAYELMAGMSPFWSAQPMDVIQNVMRGIAAVNLPAALKGYPSQYIKALLKQQPEERLAMRNAGLKKVMEHKWFSGNHFDWKAMQEQKLKPPYTPQLQSETDTSHLKVRTEQLPRPLPYDGMPDDPNWDAKFACA